MADLSEDLCGYITCLMGVCGFVLSQGVPQESRCVWSFRHICMLQLLAKRNCSLSYSKQAMHTHTHTQLRRDAGPDKGVIKAAGFLISIITIYQIFFYFSLHTADIEKYLLIYYCSLFIDVLICVKEILHLVLNFPRQTKEELETVSLLSFQVSQTSQSKPNQLHCMYCK